MSRMSRPQLFSADSTLTPITNSTYDSKGDTVADLPYHSRKASLPLTGERRYLRSYGSSMTLTDAYSQGEGQVEEAKASGIRGLFRRASTSIKNKARQRRHSHAASTLTYDAVDGRPITSWGKLRQAANFHRHSKVHENADSFDTWITPIPGNGKEPPYIPHGVGGAAARATAAAQNEFYSRHLAIGDSESGIGIALASDDEAVSDKVNRVDFVGELPIELAIQILTHLDHTGLAAVAKTSKKWAHVAATRHVWREAFQRTKTTAYATGKPVPAGAGLGVPLNLPGSDWRAIYKARQNLEKNWKQGKTTLIQLNGHLDSIYCVQFDESKIITGSRDKTIRIWDMHTYECTKIIGPPDVVRDASLLYGENGKPLHYAVKPDSSRTAACVPATVSFPTHHNASILCLQYDDEILVTGSSDSSCIVYDIKDDYRPIRRLRHHGGAVLDLAFDKKHIVTCSKDATICIWDRETGAMLKQFHGHSGPVNAVQLRGNTVVSCSGDFKVMMWNIETGKPIRELTGHTKGLACSQFSEDSKIIASAGNDKVIRVWDANTGECTMSIDAHELLVRSLHIDSISGRLISGSYDSDIKVFDLETGCSLIEFPNWHSSWVLGAKSDYRRIVSTGQDPKILIMDFGLGVEGIDLLESIPRQASLDIA